MGIYVNGQSVGVAKELAKQDRLQWKCDIVKSLSYEFDGYTGDLSILEGLDTSQVENWTYGFRKCTQLKDVSCFDFSNAKNYVVGSNKINGKSYVKNRAYCTKVSLIDGTFVTNKLWKSDNGFQQILLVKNNVPVKFKGSVKTFIRRALCKDKNKTFLIESNYPMTMSTFAKYCSEHCSDAVYLDMGEYGYGYIKNGFFTRPLYIWGYFTRHKQTNWLYIE
jgi:hypothetical protein